MRKIVTALALAATLAACSAPTEEPAGHPDVVQRIEQTSNCKQLQREFDNAETLGNHFRDQGRLDEAQKSTADMEAADARMEEVGCY